MTDFVLSPAGLFLRGAATFLVAAIDGRDDVNVFALHRIKKVERLFKQPLVLPKGFRLQEWLQNGGGDFGSDGLIELELKVSSDLARVLIETPLTEQMTAEQLPSGQFLIKTKVLNTPQLRWWLLSQSYNLMVVNPPHLAQLINEHHAKAAAQYQL